MMTARNDITGNLIATRVQTPAFSTGWDLIFKPKDEVKPAETTSEVIPQK
jgi:hypothetical protein